MKTMEYITKLLIILLLFNSCEKDKNYTPVVIKDKIIGYVQKGPYINGTAITIYDLNNDLNQTGRTYSSQIIDNSGIFELKNIELSSNFIQLRADGFYFNEITCQQSAAQLTLFALSNVEDTNQINVNILSHLEKERVIYLVNKGLSFNKAKSQVIQEILNLFSISKTEIKLSEMLDISKSEDDNAILLAISIILQGYRTEGELTELLSSIITDIRIDGILNSNILGSDLINGIKYVDLGKVRENIEYRYLSLGIEASIPDFEKYVKLFVDSTVYEFTNYITYPTDGKWGKNILNISDTIFVAGNYYSMAALLPSGTKLIVKQDGNYTGALGYPLGQENTGWDDLGPDETMVWRTYRTNRTGEVDLKMFFTDNVTLYIYENDSDSPTRIKKLYKSE